MLLTNWLRSLTTNCRRTRSRRIRNQRSAHWNRYQPALSRRPIGIEELEERTLLTVFTVVNAYDSGSGSLRDAIAQANVTAGADSIIFDTSLAGQTILLEEELEITDDLIITGSGADILTIDGNQEHRIFKIADDDWLTFLTVEISGLRLTNGSADSGGAIFNHENLKLTNCEISHNQALYSGGAIYNKKYAQLITDSCTISDNSAKNGGGVYLDNYGEFLAINSTYSSNQAESTGGALLNLFGYAYIRNSTISGNQALNYTGGGIFCAGIVDISASTIVLNHAKVSGGGIYNHQGDFNVDNSIVAGNTAETEMQIRGDYTDRNNLVQDSLVNVIDPVLKFNGGATKTHALLPGSPAIDAGNDIYIRNHDLTYDQRGDGFARIAEGVLDIGALEVQGPFSQLDLRVVRNVTTTGSQGETFSLPDNVSWLEEWGGYWLEIWIRTPERTDLGVLSASVELSYNTLVTTATNIEFGDAFTLNQSGTINDESGSIENLSAETSLTDAGDDQYVLFARVRFESLAEDSLDLDLENKSLTPISPSFKLRHSRVELVGIESSETVHGLPPTTEIYANPYDLNDDGVISYRDLILFASVYQATPSQSGSKYAWFADLNQDDAVGYRDLIFVAANYGKSKQNPQPMVYPANFPAAWNQLLVAETFDTSDSVPAPASAPVTQAIVQTAFSGVINQVSDSLSEEQNQILQTTEIVVADLEGDTLGRAAGGTIYIDVNAAGYGWYVDVSPLSYDDFYFESELTLIALPGSEADGLFDLQTVIIHELGHLLGFEHREDGLMQDTLAPGIRLLPDWELNLEFEQDLSVDETDAFFLDLPDDAVLSPF